MLHEKDKRPDKHIIDEMLNNPEFYVKVPSPVPTTWDEIVTQTERSLVMENYANILIQILENINVFLIRW